jgi:preprotein translocase subunit SecE
MSSKAESQIASKLDVAKLWVAGLVVAAGVVAFYYFGDRSLLLRVVGLLVVVAIAITIALMTAKGQDLWRFMQDARGELRKVDWPTRAETVQTSLAVFAMVAVLGVLLYLMDRFLFWAVRLLTGQGG